MALVFLGHLKFKKKLQSHLGCNFLNVREPLLRALNLFIALPSISVLSLPSRPFLCNPWYFPRELCAIVWLNLLFLDLSANKPSRSDYLPVWLAT